MTYIKEFPDHRLATLETFGHAFLVPYYEFLPRLLKSDVMPSGSRIEYEDITCIDQGRFMTDLMEKGVYPTEFNAIVHSLSNSHAQEKEARTPQGGTVLFYKQRLQRLQARELNEAYRIYVASVSETSVNNKSISIDPVLIEKVHTRMSGLSLVTCVPSQGDFHERNICSNGYLIDFEAAGWNALSTDIATFVWHTLCVGNYFGPKYAKWSTGNLGRYYMRTKQLSATSSGVTVKLDKVRKQMLATYMQQYVDVVADENDVRDASQAIAFRLLSMFEPHKMPPRDQRLVYDLANYFASPEASLQEKIAAFIS